MFASIFFSGPVYSGLFALLRRDRRGGIVSGSTPPPVAMSNVASADAIHSSTWSPKTPGVPECIEHSIGTAVGLVNTGSYLMSPTKSPASVAITRIVE